MSFIWNMLRVKGLKEKGGYRKGGKSWGVKDFSHPGQMVYEAEAAGYHLLTGSKESEAA